ncbi:exodeoxyribonuclease V subunit beta [Desulfocastanea catecholica]
MMHSNYEIFDAARLALQKGVNLVEASAGTGKTYAIGMLVLRALVELGQPIEKILIVTFTKAATEELKSRIRARLVEARELLSGTMGMSGKKIDHTLLEWAESIKDHHAAVNLLQLALYDIDRASIFTIHGFCQRMLVEQALESGQLFDVELLTDINHIRSQVADDFWRTWIYPLAPLPCALLTGSFSSPDKLLASVSRVFNGEGRIEPRVGTIDAVLVELQTAMTTMALWWRENRDELFQCFSGSLSGGYFKKPFSADFEAWFGALGEFFSGKSLSVPDNICLLQRQSLVDQLHGTKIRGEAKKIAFLTDWPLPDSEINALLEAVASLTLAFRVKLAEELCSEVSRRLLKQGTMGFNDLILRLSAALKGEPGESGYRLRQILGERFSVALIDEFQDTDNSQWHIFSTLFGGGHHYLYLIGDPKQAIYKFRGADIHSYFLARKSAGRLLTLEKNYRSHPFLVEEVNRLFCSRNRPFFFDESTLDYRPVLAARKAGDIDLTQGGRSLAGMVYCTLDSEPEDKNGRWTSGKAAEQFRRFIVSELGRLLDPASPALLQTTGQLPQQRPLAPQDIAILVRSNRQAEEYRQALTEAAIPAVVGSRQSVYQTRECRELFLLLQAIAAPGETEHLKTALTISWFGFTGNRLHELWQDEEQLSRYHNRFLQYSQRWQEQGVLPMMMRLLVTEEVLPTLATRQLAERAIANILHLIELIGKQENEENLGKGQILQWLRQMMQGSQSAENAELLLESDEEAVRIVTMHSAKGLEYPVVFCPYLWYAGNRIKGEKYQISCHDEAHQALIDLGSDLFPTRREQAAREEMAEDLRLLYVALTRAQIRCYIGWADVKAGGSVGDSWQSALGYLLFAEGRVDYQVQQEKFHRLAQEESVQYLLVSAEESAVSFRKNSQETALHPLQASGRSLLTDWQMSSYSAMAALSEYAHAAVVAAPGIEYGQPMIPVTGLPAGPHFGNVIHDLLESLSFTAIARHEDEERLLSLITQKCMRYGVQAAAEEIKKMLELVVTTPLTTGSYTLAMLADTLCLKEMAFYFHLSRLATDRINDLLAEEPTFVPLGHKVMRGYLTGFVDLICAYDGKYYILDYKTNFLGELQGDYAPDKLVAAMQAHNYGLQYWIYTLVLHRHLHNCVPGYNYAHHFGGVRYLFVRGMDPRIAGSGVYAALPAYDKVVQLDLALGGGDND